ncbi:MAG TPA: SRPBCC family protein [Flavisolibacter sp.]|nr:SRPBCC family protein [Flavisolibacter sp.]
MVISAQATTYIKARPAKVAAYAFDPSNGPFWVRGVLSIRPVYLKPLADGARMSVSLKCFGRSRVVVMELVEFDSPQAFALKTAGRRYGTYLSLSLNPHGVQHTRVDVKVEHELSPWARVFSPLVKLFFERKIRADLERLKNRIEVLAKLAAVR